MLRGEGFLESDGLLRGLEPSQVVSSLLRRVASGGWIWIVRQAWTGVWVTITECEAYMYIHVVYMYIMRASPATSRLLVHSSFGRSQVPIVIL